MAALEEMTGHAEKVLQLLGRRTVKSSFVPATWVLVLAKLRPGSMDPGTEHLPRDLFLLHVWDFQARRMQARCRSKSDKKPVWFIP